MKVKRGLNIELPSLELNRTPEERVQLEESLYQDIVKLQKRKITPFAQSFSSFKAYEAWKAKQKDPWLW